MNRNLRFWKDDLPTATGSQDPDKACNPFTHPVASRPEPVSLWGSYSVNSPITEPHLDARVRARHLRPHTAAASIRGWPEWPR